MYMLKYIPTIFILNYWLLTVIRHSNIKYRVLLRHFKHSSLHTIHYPTRLILMRLKDTLNKCLNYLPQPLESQFLGVVILNMDIV